MKASDQMDITQAMCKLCAIVMPVNVLTSVKKVKVKKKFSNAALTAHILSETRDESTSTCADNRINE